MPWTGHEPEQLRTRVHEVDYLRHKQQHHCFAEMAQNADNGQSHAREVAERVAHKHTGRVPALLQ